MAINRRSLGETARSGRQGKPLCTMPMAKSSARIISGQLLEIVAEIERQQRAKAGAHDTASRLVAMNGEPPVREEASC
jgi:hypothetical protein